MEQSWILLCRARRDPVWAFGGLVAPTLGRHVGMCPGSPGERKSSFAHTLRPGPVSSLLSSTVLLCTCRRKMIFCLKHFFLNLHFYSRRRSDCFVSLEKRSWGSRGRSGKCPRSLGRSHGWAGWLSPHQTLPPLRDAIPNAAPWDELSTRHPRGVKWCVGVPGGLCPCCKSDAGSAGGGEERGGSVGRTQMLTPQPWELEAALAVPRQARGASSAREDAPWPTSPSSSRHQITNSLLQRRNWAAW